MSTPDRDTLGPDPNRLLTPTELAEILGVVERTLRVWAGDGGGPRRLRIGGRHIRYRVSDVVAWLDTQYVDKAES